MAQLIKGSSWKLEVTQESIHKLLEEKKISATVWAEKTAAEFFYPKITEFKVKPFPSETSYVFNEIVDARSKDDLKTYLEKFRFVDEKTRTAWRTNISAFSNKQIIDSLVTSLFSFDQKEPVTDIMILDRLQDITISPILSGYFSPELLRNKQYSLLEEIKKLDINIVFDVKEWWDIDKYTISEDINTRISLFLSALGGYFKEGEDLGIYNLNTILKSLPIEIDEKNTDSIIRQIQLGILSVIKTQLLAEIALSEKELKSSSVSMYLVLKSIQRNMIWKKLPLYAWHCNQYFHLHDFDGLFKPAKHYLNGRISFIDLINIYDGDDLSEVYQNVGGIRSLSSDGHWSKVEQNPDLQYYAEIYGGGLDYDLPKILNGKYLFSFLSDDENNEDYDEEEDEKDE